MKQSLLLFSLVLYSILCSAQKGKGSIRLCAFNDETREPLEDTLFVSLEGIKKSTFIVTPENNGCLLLPRLAYGTYKLSIHANDYFTEKLSGIVLKDTTPVLLDFRLKSSIIKLEMELIAYPPKPILLTPDSWKTMPRKTNREQQISDSLYAIHRKEQKLEHERLKNGTWQMTDSLRNKDVLDTDAWKTWMKQHFPYPQEAIEMGIQAKVYMSFRIDEQGAIQHIALLRGYDPELAIPLAHFLNSAPGIKPPRNESGKSLPQKYFLFLRFTLVD